MRCFLVVSLLLAACGDDGGSGRLADAPPSSDAPAAPQPVTLTVTDRGAPVAGVHVYFLNPDDSTVATVDTDTTGTASAVMPSGGSVTAIDPFPGRAAVAVNFNELRTFLGVKPGDHLVLTGARAPVTFTLYAPAVAGASDYLVYTSCGTGSIAAGGGAAGSGSPDPGGAVTLYGCGATLDVLVLARNSDFIPTSALYHAGATVPQDGALDLTADSYQAFSNVAFSYSHVSQNAFSLNLAYSLATSRGALSSILNQGLSPDQGSATLTAQLPALSGTTAVVDTSLLMNGQHHVIEWGAPAASYALDLAGVLLPDILFSPSYNPTTRRMSWIEDATGATADVTHTAIDVNRQSDTGSRSWRWEIAGPYTPGELKFPKLPTDAFDWTARATDSVQTEIITNAKVPGGYDAVRPRIFDLRNQPDFSGVVAGASGRAVIVQSQDLRLRVF